MLYRRELTPNAPYATLYWGAQTQTIQVGNHSRRFLTYIPDGARSSTAGIFILGKNGSTVDELLRTSGWQELADKEKVILFLLEPENGVWHTDEPYGSQTGDVAYVNAVMIKSQERLHYCVHEAKYYIYGEGEGGTIAHMAAMNPPEDVNASAIIWSGVTTFCAGEVPKVYLDACREAPCVNLMGFWDWKAQTGWRKGDIPMPVWMIEPISPNTETLRYWREANGTETEFHLLPDGTEEYARITDTEYPLDQDRTACRVWRTSGGPLLKLNPTERAEQVWSRFLSRHRRWMGDLGGELRMALEPVRDLGMEYHMEEIGGWLREWYVYVPESVKKASSPVPLVFALHGYSCSGEIYIGNSGWYRVAEKRGFIVVFPTALPGTLGFKSVATDPCNVPMPAWNFLHNMPNGPDEFAFFKELLNRVALRHSIDPSRVYVTGHSHGSMMTQALALGMPGLFAAAAPCSGVILEPMHETFTSLPEICKHPSPLPIWMFAGKEEKWLIDPLPSPENATGKTLAIWHTRNALPGDAKERFATEGTLYKDRWHDLSYPDAQGHPMLRFTTVDRFPHATNPEMSWRIWDEFFAHWSREGGVCLYH